MDCGCDEITLDRARLDPGSRRSMRPVRPPAPEPGQGADQGSGSPTTLFTSEPRGRRVPGWTPLRMASVSSETGPG